MSSPSTLSDAVQQYLELVRQARSEKTAATYQNGLNFFLQVLKHHKLDPQTIPPSSLTENAVTWLAADLKAMAPATERLYLTAASGFYEYLAAENLAVVNLPKLRLLIRQRARRPGQRLPQFPADAIETVINHLINITNLSSESDLERLRDLRDRAFLVTLSDTGLRVHEACGLRRGDIDWNEGRAVIIGKGDKQAVVRFSDRSMRALKDYLSARAALDGSSGRPLGSLPLFARHDKGAGKKVRAMTTTTGRNIVADWVRKILGEEAVGTITPHSFRHYFVTRVLRGSGNLKLAQELARHKNISITQRYAHLSDDELDQGYWQVFEQK